MTRADSFIEIARIVKPQGIRGELKLLVYSQTPEALRKYRSFFIINSQGLSAELSVESFRTMARCAILKFAEINDRNEAEQYRDCAVLIKADQLQQAAIGEYYIRDLIGAQVVTEQGEALGALQDVLELPAHDVYQVGEGNKELLIPAIAGVVLDIQIEKKLITVRLPDGLREL
jgi:16S rRNA processing protein RimM